MYDERLLRDHEGEGQQLKQLGEQHEGFRVVFSPHLLREASAVCVRTQVTGPSEGRSPTRLASHRLSVAYNAARAR